MFSGVLSTAFADFPGNAMLIALLVLPLTLAMGFARACFLARRSQPDFSLRKLESFELERAVILLQKVVRRIEDIAGTVDAGAHRSKRSRQKSLRQIFGHELEDLETYARDLRSTIITIRSRPLQRYRRWIHVVSARYFWGRTAAFYSVGLAVAAVVRFSAEPKWWPLGLYFDLGLMWGPLWQLLLWANWMAATCAAVVAPLLYFIRRNRLQAEHRHVLEELKRFAEADPTVLVSPHGEDGDDTIAIDINEDARWFAILGVLPSASIGEVKQAYKSLIKANHPDRVHGMSPAFRTLAEAETKKLNVAYAEALSVFRNDERLEASLQEA